MDIKNIPGLFEEQAHKFPDHVAAIYGKLTLTYGELNRKANQLAHYLLEKGVQLDVPVALCLPRSFDFLIAIIAILKAGGAYLPLDASQPEERLLFLLNDSKPPVLITRSTLKDKFSHYQGELIQLDVDKKSINQQASENIPFSPAPEHLAYIIYTSGSTGSPKGVLIEHRSVVNYSQWFREYNKNQPQQRIDFSANPVFDMAVSVSLVPLIQGLTSVICKDEIKKNTKNYLNYLASSGIHTIKITPSYFKILLQEAKNNFIDLPELKSIILGGENLSAIECKSWLALYPEHVLFNEYGPTETTVATSVYKVCPTSLSEFGDNVPIGKAGTKMSYLIVDKQHNPVPDGETGELLIGGMCLARSYLNRDDLNQLKFVKNPLNKNSNERLYKTGDLCHKRADGIIEYHGRIDDQVKIRGFRIEPGEIENNLATHPAIKTVVVVAQKDASQEQRLVAYYVRKDSYSTLNANQLRKFLTNRVPNYMIPDAFIRLDVLPLNANGKLDKSALPRPRLEASQHYIEPVTALEKKIARIWSEELGVQLIGLNDNFFELGGHSLSAARLVSKINHRLGKDISLHDFYEASCIAKLIPLIKKTRKIKAEKIKSPEKKYTEVINTPLSDFQFLLWMSDTFEPKAKTLNIMARRQFQGHFNKAALENAFQAVLKKHEALIYWVLKLKPKQQVQKNSSFRLIEKNISSLSEQQQKQELETSAVQLTNLSNWPKNSPLIIGKLFYLKEDSIELQICMPHMISDDASIDILLTDLSKFYLLYDNEHAADPIEIDTHYKKYVFTEQHAIEASLDKNIKFWDEYFQDASFFAFPEKHVVKDMKAANLPYSTYTQIPRQSFINLKHFCEQQHISINNGLCTVLSAALRNCSDTDQKSTPFTVMSIIKSTRDNPIYDHSIGCFLRIEPIKIALNNDSSLEKMSKQIRQSMIDTSNYQQCSTMIKLSSVTTMKIKKKKIQHYVIDLLAPIGATLLRVSSSYRKILRRSITHFVFFKRDNNFLINLNVRNNFLTDSDKNINLFGLKPQEIPNHQDDLLAINSIFEACFFYDENQKAHTLVLSANLTPEFREQIAQEVIQIMSYELNANDLQEINQQDLQPV